MNHRFLLGYFLLLACACERSGNESGVHKTLDAASSDAIYHASSGLCSVTWTLRGHGTPVRYGIRESSRCLLTNRGVTPLRARLIGALRADLGSLRGVERFYWGALKRDDAAEDVSERLMAAAAASPLWDAGKGVPVKGREFVADVTRELLNSADAFRELKGCFQPEGMAVVVSHVEMVNIQSLSAASVLAGRGNEALLLPVDALVELSLHPTQDTSSSGSPPSR